MLSDNNILTLFKVFSVVIGYLNLVIGLLCFLICLFRIAQITIENKVDYSIELIEPSIIGIYSALFILLNGILLRGIQLKNKRMIIGWIRMAVSRVILQLPLSIKFSNLLGIFGIIIGYELSCILIVCYYYAKEFQIERSESVNTLPL